MTRFLMIGTCATWLTLSGVALAQTPPAPPSDGPRGDAMEHMHWHRPWMERGTTFRFKKGDASVSISCSPREAVQACVTGASALLDKLGASAPAK